MIASAGCETLDEFMAFTTLTICYNSKRLVENVLHAAIHFMMYENWVHDVWLQFFFHITWMSFSGSGVEIAFIKKDCLIYQLIVWKLSWLGVVKRP